MLRPGLVLALLVSVLAACGGTPAATSPAGIPTPPPAGNGTTSSLPCEAIAADVTTALGTAKVINESVPELSSCTFNLTDAGPDSIPGLGGAVIVRLETAGSTDLSTMKGLWPDGGEDLTGIGDAAYWAPEVDVLYAVKNGNTYAVQLVTIGGEPLADPRAVAVAIMQGLFAKI